MKFALAAAVASALTLGACATATGPDRYQAELDRLEADCAARDGILQATGALTGQASRDYACRITPATRIPGR